MLLSEKVKTKIINKWGVDHVSKIPEVSDIKSLRMKEKSVEISILVNKLLYITYKKLKKVN